MDHLRNPSALMRPAPFWSWNDKLDEAELRRQIREMAKKGWGSYFMHSRVGLVTRYLSDEWMDLVNACADEAEKTGTFAWLYDEDKWPSGFAGGEVPEKDERHRARSLVLLKEGDKTENDTVLARASWGGVDYEICRRISPLGDPWFNGASYVDLMSPDAVREFIDCTHERYKEACGRHFGKAIPGIFTDEPCYLTHMHGTPAAVPWSDFLPGFFKELKGYDILDRLPLLFFDMKGYRRVRFDFYDAAAELLKRSFTKQYYNWCEENHLIMTGHFMAEDALFYQTQWSGDVMSQYEFMHWPGIDKLGRHTREIVTVKQVSSATDQLAKERAFCEVFGCAGGQVSFFHRKWIGDWQAALGINFVNHHLSLYSMRGERKRDYPANLFYQQPWWEDEKGFADYQARLCAAVSEGQRLVDILVIQPLSSVWSEYSPLHKDSGFSEEKVYDEPFAELSRKLMAEQLDFHYGNENLIAKYGSVVTGDEVVTGDWAEGPESCEGTTGLGAPGGQSTNSGGGVTGDAGTAGAAHTAHTNGGIDLGMGGPDRASAGAGGRYPNLRLGRHSYSCVLVPPASNLKSSTLALLKGFAAAGGHLIFTRAIPSLVDGEEAEAGLAGARVAGSLDEAVRMVSLLFPHRIKVEDTLAGTNAASIYLHSRRTEGGARHLFVNTDERREVRARIGMPRDLATGGPTAFDLYSGELWGISAENGSFEVTFAPAGSLLVVSGQEATETGWEMGVAQRETRETEEGAGHEAIAALPKTGEAWQETNEAGRRTQEAAREWDKSAGPLFLGSGAVIGGDLKALLDTVPAAMVDAFDCEVQGENTLLLNDFSLELDGEQVYEGPVCGAWHKHFYPAPDGTPFRAAYSFQSESAVPGCFAAIEAAENLDRITLNRAPVRPLKGPGEPGAFDPEKSWKDINFTRVPLPDLKKGENILAIEGRKVNNITGPGFHERVPDWHGHRPTEAEEVYICGQFSLKPVSEGTFIVVPFRQPSGKNLTREGFPFYCGRALFRASFRLSRTPEGKGRVILQLNAPELACARVRLNGRKCGTLRWPPFVLDITHAVVPGHNALEIEAATTLVNAFGPNRRAGVKDETGIGPHSFIDMTRFKEGYELFDFGIESAAVYVWLRP